MAKITAAVISHIAAAALPVAPPATVPVWGPSAIDLFGAQIPIASMLLSLAGLIAARQVSSAREGKAPGSASLTIVLIIITIGLVIERQPGPGMAAAWGVGVGASGIIIYDLVKRAATRIFGGGDDGKA